MHIYSEMCVRVNTYFNKVDNDNNSTVLFVLTYHLTITCVTETYIYL
jgi:hypothetical protein